MKKEEFAGLFVYLIMLGLALIYAFTVLRTHSGVSTIKGAAYFFYILGAIVVGIILGGILLEVGHIVGAKIGHYDIFSVNVLFLCFTKVNGKWKVGFKKYDGLTGETIIYPDENKESKANPKPYLYFGTLFEVLLTIVCIVIFIILNSVATLDATKWLYDIAYFILTVGILALMLVIYNIMPFELDTMNDGYKLSLVKNPKNKEAYNELLKIKYCKANNIQVPELKTFTDITNYTAELNLNKVYKCIGENNDSEALVILDLIVDNHAGLNEKIYLQALSQSIGLRFKKDSISDVNEYLDKNVPISIRRTLSEANTMETIRAYAYISALIDKSRSECEIVLSRAVKAYNKCPKDRREIETKLLNEAIDKIDIERPNWNIKDYKLIVNAES